VTRDATIQVRLPSETKAEIERLAESAGKSVTDYVIAASLGGGPVEYDARYALARQVVGSVGDPRGHARAVKRLAAFCDAGGIDLATQADGDGDVFAQACVLAMISD
jgi:hypothetical protein